MKNNKINLPFRVKSVDGFAMLLNKKKINIIIKNESGDDHNKENYFDENFFMYLENDDLCKRKFIMKVIFLVDKSLSSFQEIGIGFGQSFILIKNILVFLKLLQKVFQNFFYR